MTKKEFDKVNELKLKLKKIENDKNYFGYNRFDEKVQFPFSFSFKKKRGKIYCTVRPYWSINAQPIAVDEEFVKYCKKYFEEKSNKLNEEIDGYFDEKTIEKKDKNDESEQVVQLLLDMLKNKKQQEEMIEENVTNSEEILEVSDL